MRRSLILVGVVLLASTGCDGDEEPDPGSDAGDEAPVDAGMTSRPPPGPSADGWESDWVEGSAGASCDADEADLADLAHLTFGDSTIYVGFRQASGNNQNPIVARFDGGTRIWCVEHETQGPDGRAEAITWDGGDHAYVVYSVVGGGTDLEGHGGWLSSYAPGAISGGGPKVSVVGRVSVEDGSLDAATFIVSVLSSGRVNTHAPAGAVTVLEDGSVEFAGDSAHKPIDADGRSSMDCTDYPFSSRYRFSADLSELVCADCTNCTSQRPCE
ncbi:MAG TPA: hypothetical protein RMH99_29980 [Sandaracinaceae bacterium LLY-WYZ-13_1]|nr:hypothetical protein [Sandaracinaceae bacterium LLY-WYZ-13_1]